MKKNNGQEKNEREIVACKKTTIMRADLCFFSATRQSSATTLAKMMVMGPLRSGRVIKRSSLLGGGWKGSKYQTKNNRIYNNTFYIKEGVATPIVDGAGSNRGRTYFTNNILCNHGSGGYDPNINVIYSHNIFHGNHPPSEPADPHKITADPQLVDAGSGGTGRDSVGGYKLEAGSPAIGSGKLIEDNGGRDYFGKTVPADAPPNRGASENRP